MMFISTVVHIFEFILLSLLGIMLYRLFASYKKWKNLSVSSSSKGGDRSGRIVKPSLPQNPDYLSVSKITVTEENSASQSVKTKQSSVILTDYIGEFFAESKPMDLEPYRASQIELIPTLREFVDNDTDAYITVASARNEVKANNVMSDKVVMAMLDEAKLVCAS